jgi:glycerol-3-phosphate dehydrogenase
VTLVGTTDVDYGNSLDEEPGITAAEVAYLMAAVEARYPMIGIELGDVISTFAGVRPVIGSGKENPSEESRDHVIWEEEGLLTVTGGKLTTFRLVALEVLAKARKMTAMPEAGSNMPVLDAVTMDLTSHKDLAESVQRRLLGRHGADAPALLAAAHPGELEHIPGTNLLWAEMRWAARAEGVVHLDDLLLRRVRLGLLAKNGAKAHLPRIRAICQEELGWSDTRWEAEKEAYVSLWDCCYSLPPASTIPDWRIQLSSARRKQDQARLDQEPKSSRSWNLGLAAFLTALAFLLAVFFVRKRGDSLQ